MLAATGIGAFYGRAHILAGVGFEVAKGEVLALLGRNGAGKSTTLKTVIGLVRPVAGEIVFEGNRIDGLAPNRIAQLGVGWVPEDRRIFTDLTVAENLEVGRQRPREGASSWTTERLFQLFPNLEELRNRSAGRISGGEQQMLTIARTLMGNPKLVLLDEPSEGLAPKIVEQMATTILALKREGLALLLSEQNLHFARLVADRATIIEKGRIRYEATMDALARDAAVQREYLSA
jgi:branched-chain amino acid transport system ATP-binding protein